VMAVSELGVGPGREGLRRAYEEHHARLFRLCLLLSGHRELAEDIAQDAFVRAAERLETLPASEAGPYLRTTAVNVWGNQMRRRALELRNLWRFVGRASESPDALVEERERLWPAVLRLPTRQRACVVLRYYEDLSEQETARVLGCSVGTVKSQTSRALARLRERMHHG
jgi:RNA polymerase sigma-70 factor (sigma-E family)